MTTAQDVALAAALEILKARKAKAARYVDDPVGWVKNVLGEHLWSKQREVIESVRDNRHTAVPSAHDTGKSFVAARTAAWWLDVHPPGEAFVVTTAPTFHQVRAILWREINRAHAKGKLRGFTNQTEWWMGGELVAYGRKPADYHEDAFQGIHARYVLIILDEGGGVPKQLYTAAETLATNEHSRILAIGNPDSPLTHFKRVCDLDLWNVIHINGLESPNFTHEFEEEGVPEKEQSFLRDVLLSPTFVEERREEWGEDSNLWQAKILGEFPTIPVGQVYKELSQSMRWAGPLPSFRRLVGGLDFGGANDQAHKTSGVVAGLAHDDSIDLPRLTPIGSQGVLVRTHHFEDAGPDVHDDLIRWMHDVESHFGRRVEWKADKTQSFGISLAKTAGFTIEPTHGGADSVWLGITMQRRRMKEASSFYVDSLEQVPKHLSGPKQGSPMDGKSWYAGMTNLRWKQEPDEDRAVPGVPIKRDDDTADADRYLHEAADGFPMDTGPIVSNTYLDGSKRTTQVA